MGLLWNSTRRAMVLDRGRASYRGRPSFYGMYSVEPKTLDEMDMQDFVQLLFAGEEICKQDISEEFVRQLLDTDDVLFWIMHDERDRVTGFAAVSEEEGLVGQYKGIELKLICAMSGGGMRLFAHVLKWAERKGMHYVDLYAINSTVAVKYVDTARRLRIQAYHFQVGEPGWLQGRPMTIEDIEEQPDGTFSMHFWLGATRPHSRKLIRPPSRPSEQSRRTRQRQS